MEILTLCALTALSVFTATISATVGMAGGIVLLSFMTFFMPFPVLVPIHGMVQLVSNTSRTFLLRGHVVWPIFWPYLLGLPFGAMVAIYLLQNFPHPKYFIALIILLILYAVFRPKKMPHLKIPFWAFSLLGLLVGAIGPLIGATGPLLAPFFLRDDLSKENIVATKAVVQLVGHISKIPTFVVVGFNYFEHGLTIGLMSGGVIAGTLLGVKALNIINESLFTKIFKSALLLAALRLLIKNFIH